MNKLSAIIIKKEFGKMIYIIFNLNFFNMELNLLINILNVFKNFKFPIFKLITNLFMIK